MLGSTYLSLPDIVRNPHLHERIRETMNVSAVDELYSLLTRVLFSPHGKLKSLWDAVWKERGEGQYVIVLQLRAGIGSDMVLYNESEYDEMIADSFSAAIHIERTHAPSNVAQVVWWLVTDQDGIRATAFKRMEELTSAEEQADRASGRRRRLFWYAGSAVHMDKAVDESEVARTFVEWFAVAHAQAAVLTFESSFGLSAWMMAYRGLDRPTHTIVRYARHCEVRTPSTSEVEVTKNAHSRE